MNFFSESPIRVPGVCCDKLSEIFRKLQTFGFECYVTKLSSIYKQFTYKAFDHESISNFLSPDISDGKLSSLFHDVKNNTSKVEMLWRLRFVRLYPSLPCACLCSLLLNSFYFRYQLYFNTAKSLECQKIFVPECGTDLSIRLLSNVALGRGSQIPSDVVSMEIHTTSLFCR